VGAYFDVLGNLLVALLTSMTIQCVSAPVVLSLSGIARRRGGHTFSFAGKTDLVRCRETDGDCIRSDEADHYVCLRLDRMAL